jgi:hypothetical protein
MNLTGRPPGRPTAFSAHNTILHCQGLKFYFYFFGPASLIASVRVRAGPVHIIIASLKDIGVAWSESATTRRVWAQRASASLSPSVMQLLHMGHRWLRFTEHHLAMQWVQNMWLHGRVNLESTVSGC